jgi:transposase
MKGLTLTQAELTRLEVLNRIVAHELDVGRASELLGVSGRHVWRILAAYKVNGAAALAHGNRGRAPVNVISKETSERVVGLAATRYAGVNHTHLSELLAEREGIVLARTTVRAILTKAGMGSPRRRRPPRHRVRRERLPQEGMLLQIDGSNHDWLQGRGPRLTLLLAVDDATGTYPGALFRPEEDSLGYFLLLRGIIERHGIPLALYSDRHAAFRQVHAPRGGPFAEPTQFGRAMRDLGVTQIFALSPEAKGRIERANGTFQDRLVSELRLAGASTEAEANEVLGKFLPHVNERFGVPAARAGNAYRRVAGLELTDVFCFKYPRTVARDNTVKFRRRTLQLLPERERPTFAGVRVEVQVRLEGRLVVCHDGREIAFQEAPPRPVVLRDAATTRSQERLASDCDDQARGVVSSTGAGNGVISGGKLVTVGARRVTRHRGNGFGELDVPPERHPTPRQQARWEAVQAARQEGLNISAIGRRVGIARRTARRYAKALFHPPVNTPRRNVTDHDDAWAGHELIDRDLEGTPADELAELIGSGE